MEIFDVSIYNIQEVREGKRVVFATIDTSFYGGKQEGVKCAFMKSGWNRIKTRMSYKETEIMPQETGEYLESLPEDEWSRRFERDLSKVPDRELVEEVNRRLKSQCFHNIAYNVELVMKDAREAQTRK